MMLVPKFREGPSPKKMGPKTCKTFVICYQVQVHGLTGAVKFDKYGTRTGFSLDVLEVSLGRGLAKVSRHCILYPH